MNKIIISKTIWKIIKIFWGLFCVLLLIVQFEDFNQALTHPELYPFGAEGPVAGLGYYKSQEAYLSNCVFWIFWYIVGFIFCLSQYKFQKLKLGIIIHIFITLLFVFYINFLYS